MQIRTLHFEYTTACNSRCRMCSYWKDPSPRVLSNETVFSAVSALVPQGLRKVYFTGGECLLCADALFEVCGRLRGAFPELSLCLITNGILLERYCRQVGENFRKVILSLDTVDPETYRAIRGVDALPVIRRGIVRLRESYPQVQVNLRVLVMNDTAGGIPAVITYAAEQGLHHVSFLPEDVSSGAAFGRDGSAEIPSHCDACLPPLREAIAAVKSRDAALFGTLLPHGCGDLEEICSLYEGKLAHDRKCNKAFHSCVVSAEGTVSPCFFIPGSGTLREGGDIEALLMSESYRGILSGIAEHRHPACRTCACPKELS